MYVQGMGRRWGLVKASDLRGIQSIAHVTACVSIFQLMLQYSIYAPLLHYWLPLLCHHKGTYHGGHLPTLTHFKYIQILFNVVH